MTTYNPGDIIGGRWKVAKIFGGEGKSGMGIVYICLSIKEKKIVALKTFQDRFHFSEDAIKSFQREASVLIQLDPHPNIVTTLFVELMDSKLFIGLECILPDDIGRNTLTHYLSTPNSFSQILIWGIEFCRGMEHAYSHGISCHRDIKPDNIMVSYNRTIKITDFGLAKSLRDSEITLEPMNDRVDISKGLGIYYSSQEGKIVGTPPWMAPEQFEGITDIRSDIYSFGIVLFQLVNHGELPFITNTIKGFKDLHQNHNIPHFESDLFPIIEKCMQKSAEDRYENFTDLRLDLENIYEKNVSENIPSPPSISFDNRMNKGISYLNLNLNEEAIEIFENLLKEDKNNFSTHSMLGLCFVRKRQLNKAVFHLNKAINLNPNEIEPYVNLGNAQKLSGQYEKAILTYNKALKLNSHDHKLAHAYNALGNTLAVYESKKKTKKKNFQEAINSCEKAIQLNPNHYKNYEFLSGIYSLRGNHYSRIGYPHKATSDYLTSLEFIKKAYGLNPYNITTLTNLGSTYALLHKNNEAIKILNKVLEINPNYFLIYNILAECHYREKNYEKAFEFFQMFIKVAPSPRFLTSINNAQIRSKELKRILKL